MKECSMISKEEAGPSTLRKRDGASVGKRGGWMGGEGGQLKERRRGRELGKGM